MTALQTQTPKPRSARKKSVFIVDDHPLVRTGLRALISIEPDLEVAGEFDRARGAVDAILGAEPDVILIDLSLPDGSGYPLVKDLRSMGVSSPILVVSMHPEAAFAERALKAGANGYLMKHAAPDQVIDAIRQILAGEVYVSAEFARHSKRRLTSTSPEDDRTGVELLTAREFEVFQFIAQGIPPREMARQLSISPKTVEAHRTNIRSKLGLTDGAQLVRYAIRWLESQTGSDGT